MSPSTHETTPAFGRGFRQLGQNVRIQEVGHFVFRENGDGRARRRGILRSAPPSAWSPALKSRKRFQRASKREPLPSSPMPENSLAPTTTATGLPRRSTT